MTRAVLIAIVLAFVPATARAGDYDMPLTPCSQSIGVIGVEQGGITGSSSLCTGTDYVYEVVVPPQHGVVTYGRHPFQNGPTLDWMYDMTYVPDPALPVGATDEWQWDLHDGDRVSAVYTTRIRILARGTINALQPVVPPPLTMTAKLVTRHRRAVRRRGLRLQIACDAVCATRATVTYRGKPAGEATATAAGTLVVRLKGAARRARHPKLHIDVSAVTAAGATAARRVTVTLRG